MSISNYDKDKFGFELVASLTKKIVAINLKKGIQLCVRIPFFQINKSMKKRI